MFYTLLQTVQPVGAGDGEAQFSMSSIKRDVKKKVLPRPEVEKIVVSRSSPTDCKCPSIALEGFCSGLSALPVGFIFRW